MLARLIVAALVAGGLAGIFLFAAHMVVTTPLVLQAEVYEKGDHSGQDHHKSTQSDSSNPSLKNNGHGHQSHSHEAAGSNFERHGLSLVSDMITAVAFAFLLTGAMLFSKQVITWRTGLVWGLCGYACFVLAPAFGLPPELPGMQAGDLNARQIWWLATALLTASGLWLIFFTKPVYWKGAAGILILAPHVFGAPHSAYAKGPVPAELAAQFVVSSLVVSGIFWLLLGALSGYFFNRWCQRS